MGNLLGSLELDKVEGDVNALPDGKWAGVVRDSKYVFLKAKNAIAHVITYRVTEGEFKGRERAEFFELGKDPVFSEGHEGDVNHVENYTPTMSDQQKEWYVKRFLDLGVKKEEVSSVDISTLVGKAVTFGTRRNGQYINVNFVELRDATEAPTSDAPVAGLL